MSPNGGPEFEDVCILDPTDASQWLLVAVVPSGREYVVYRRLYCGEG
jgi:hypothetical protein